ncbi:MAG: Rieske (2Fe-2S) protein [bacterium]
MAVAGPMKRPKQKEQAMGAAKPEEDREDPGGPEPARRSFLGKIWIGLGILALLEMAGVVAAFLRPRRATIPEEGPGAVFEVGPVDRFPKGSVTAFVRGKFYLARLEDGGFLALSRKCTHLGCTLPWSPEEQRFTCPCHSSAFDIRGEVIAPPAPRALDLYRVFVENKIVKVDTGRAIRRDTFKPEHVVYAEKG